MNPTERLYHTVLQKLIILFLGLLTVGVLLTSCTPVGYQACDAYNNIAIDAPADTESGWK